MAEQTTDLDWNNLSPTNPDIMQYQATINIGKVSSEMHLICRYYWPCRSW